MQVMGDLGAQATRSGDDASSERGQLGPRSLGGGITSGPEGVSPSKQQTGHTSAALNTRVKRNVLGSSLPRHVCAL